MSGERILRRIARLDLSRRPRASREHVDHLADELPRAIERDELSLHFQPIIELRTGRCYRAEALVSWPHPRSGSIAAREVVRLADLSGTTADLAVWVLREALRQRAAWQSDDLELGISMNLAGPELRGNGPTRLLDIVRQARARPAALTFEIPAATFGADAAVREGLRTLAGAGCRIALDDVSEANLPGRTRVIDVDEQKLSRSVVLRAGADEAAALALKRLLALGRDLRLVTVAVGVEDEVTYRLLGFLGCELAQGYWMSRPLATSDVAQWHAWLARAVLAGSSAIAAFSGLAKLGHADAPSREPLGGPTATVSAVALTPGAILSCCALRASGGLADVGVATRMLAVDGARLHLEEALADAEASRITAAVARDLAATQSALGVDFNSAPEIYVFASRASFALGLQRGFGQRATEASALAAGNGGVAFSDRGAIAINWENVRGDRSLAIVRHELTHLLVHQIAGPETELPAWFDEGLATVMERTVTPDAHRDAVADSATLAMLHRGDASLQELASSRDWQLKNAALGGGAYTLAAAGVIVLRESIGLDGITRLVRQARDVGFARAFGEATGGSTADYSLAFPSRFAASHGGMHLAHVPTATGVKWAVTGLAAEAKARVTIESASGYRVAFDVSADRFGTYSAVFGGTAAPGDYTITVLAPSGSASTLVSIGR